MDIKPILKINKNKISLNNGDTCDALNVMLSKDKINLEAEKSIVRHITLQQGSIYYNIVGCIPTTNKLIVFCNRTTTPLASPTTQLINKTIINTNLADENKQWVIIKSPVRENSNSLIQPSSVNIQDNCIIVIDNNRTYFTDEDIKVTDWIWRGGIVKGTYCYNNNKELIVAFTEIKTIDLSNTSDLVPLKIINLDNNSSLAGSNIELGNDTKYSVNPNTPLTSIGLIDMYNGGRSYKGIRYYFVRYRDANENCTNWQNVGQPILVHEPINKTISRVLLDAASTDNDNDREVVTRASKRETIIDSRKSYGYNYELLNDDTEYCNKALILKISRGIYSDVVNHPYIELAYVVLTDTSMKAFYIDKYKIELEALTITHSGINDTEYDIDKLLNPTIGIYNPVGIGSFENRLYVSNYRELDVNPNYEVNSDIVVRYKTEDFALNTENRENVYDKNKWNITSVQNVVTRLGSANVEVDNSKYTYETGYAGVTGLSSNGSIENYTYTQKYIPITQTLNIFGDEGLIIDRKNVESIPIINLVPEYNKSLGNIWFETYIPNSLVTSSGSLYSFEVKNSSNPESNTTLYFTNIEIKLNNLYVCLYNNKYYIGMTDSDYDIYGLALRAAFGNNPDVKGRFVLRPSIKTFRYTSSDFNRAYPISYPFPFILDSYKTTTIPITNHISWWQGAIIPGQPTTLISGITDCIFKADYTSGINNDIIVNSITIFDVYQDYDRFIPLYSSNQKSLMPNEVYKFNIHYVYKDGTYLRGYPLKTNTNRTYNGIDVRTLIKNTTLADVQHLKEYYGDYPIYTVINNATSNQFGYYRNEETGEEFFRAPSYHYLYGGKEEDVLKKITATFSGIKVPNDPNIVGMFISYDEVDSVVASTGIAGNSSGFYKLSKYKDSNVNGRATTSGRLDYITDSGDFSTNSIFYYDNRIFLDKKSISAKLLVADDVVVFNDNNEIDGTTNLTMQSTGRRSEVNRPSGSNKTEAQLRYTPIKQVDYLSSDNVAESRLGREEAIRLICYIDNDVVKEQTIFAHLLNLKTNIYPPSPSRKLINLGYTEQVTPGSTASYGFTTYNYAYDSYITRDSHLIYAYNGVEYDEDNGDFIDPINNAAYASSVVPWILLKYFKYSRMLMETRMFKEEPKPLYNQQNKTYNTVVLPSDSQNLFQAPYNFMSLNNLKVLNSYDKDLGTKAITYFNNTFRESAIQSSESQKIDWKVFPVNRYKIIPTNKGVVTNIVGIGALLLIHTEYSLFAVDTTNILETTDKHVQLGSIDAFDVQVREVFTNTNGFAGLSSILGYNISENGYCFVDFKAKKIYHYDDKSLNIISDDINERFELAIGNGIETIGDLATMVTMGYDPNNKRYIIKVPSVYAGDNGFLTMSYSLERKSWLSRHSFNPYLMVNTANDLFSLYKIYISKHSQDYNGIRANYQTSDSIIQSYPFWVETIFNKFPDTIKRLQGIEYDIINTIYDNENDLSIKDKLIILIYNDTCCTGELIVQTNSHLNKFADFINTSDGYKIYPKYVNGKMEFSEFRDRTVNGNRDFINVDRTIDYTKLSLTKEFYNTGDIYGRYIIVRLSGQNNPILFNSIAIKCTNYDR